MMTTANSPPRVPFHSTAGSRALSALRRLQSPTNYVFDIRRLQRRGRPCFSVRVSHFFHQAKRDSHFDEGGRRILAILALDFWLLCSFCLQLSNILEE